MSVSQKHTYTTPGVKTVTATDAAGNTAQAQVTVSSTGTLGVTPPSIPAGGTVSVTGAGFPPAQQVAIVVRDSASTVVGTASATTDAQGQIPATQVAISVTAASGTAVITAAGGQVTATANLTVTAAPVALAVPSGVTAAAVSGQATQLKVDWSAVPNASGYVVRWAPTGTTTWTERSQVDAPAVTDTVTGLTAATTYDVQVRAKGDGANFTDSAWSPTATGTTGS